jgi:two-component sensor histidine kinase/tetratricopeptide (TPR) repeat protein
MKRLLLLLLLATSLPGRAEPLYPLLSRTAVDSLHALLRQPRQDTNRVNALLCLSHDLLTKQEELNTPLASAYAYARQALALSQALGFGRGCIGSQYALGRLLPYRHQAAQGQALLRQALARSQQQGQRRLTADGWYYLAMAYARTEAEMPARLHCLQQARAAYRQLPSRAHEAFTLKTIADMHLLQGKEMQCRQELLQVVALYRAIGYRRLHYTFDLLVGVNKKLGNYPEALRYGLAALESAQATHDDALLAYFYARLASIYLELTQPAKALAYYRGGLASAHAERNTFFVIANARGITQLLINHHQPQQALAFFLREIRAFPPTDYFTQFRAAVCLADCYAATGDYAQAEKQGLLLIHLLETGQVYADNYSEQLTGYLAISKVYVAARQYAKARPYLTQALALEARSHQLINTTTTHLLFFKVDSAQGKLPAAIWHYQRYKALNDSVVSEAKNKLLASLQIQYDTKKKEHDIALLTKQTLLQRSSLRQKDFQRNALLAGAVLLTLLLGLGYNRYRLKQRSNRLLEAQQREINQQNQLLQRLLHEKEELLTEKDWMLKEIHHRVKNNLQIISSLLDTQADYLHDPAARAAIREGQNRVHAMALIHQKLYQSAQVLAVNMADYLREITDQLLDSFDCRARVRVRLAVVPVALPVPLATPIGLLINEALTNALKYAFPAPRRGTIDVALAERGPGQYALLIADDGVGLPPGFVLADNRTMGLTIMQGLSEQIDGELRITEAGGVRISLAFAGASPAPPPDMA